MWPSKYDIFISDKCWKFGFVNDQVSLAWSNAFGTQELYRRPHVLKEREVAGRENW